MSVGLLSISADYCFRMCFVACIVGPYSVCFDRLMAYDDRQRGEGGGVTMTMESGITTCV